MANVLERIVYTVAKHWSKVEAIFANNKYPNESGFNRMIAESYDKTLNIIIGIYFESHMFPRIILFFHRVYLQK